MDKELTNTELFSLEVAARKLGISVWTLRAHAKRRTLRTIRVGRRVLVSSTEIERVAITGLPSLEREVPRTKGRLQIQSQATSEGI
jgi:excisionase family DNA binding protein